VSLAGIIRVPLSLWRARQGVQSQRRALADAGTAIGAGGRTDHGLGRRMDEIPWSQRAGVLSFPGSCLAARCLRGSASVVSITGRDCPPCALARTRRSASLQGTDAAPRWAMEGHAAWWRATLRRGRDRRPPFCVPRWTESVPWPRHADLRQDGRLAPTPWVLSSACFWPAPQPASPGSP